MENDAVRLNNSGNTPVKNGLILGAIMCVAALAMALISPKTYVLVGRTALLIAVFYFMYKIGKEERYRHEGVLDFGEAFKAIFIGSVIAYIIFNIFEFILYNYINPDLNIIFHEATVDGVNAFMDWIGSNTDADQEALDRAKEDIANEMTPEVLTRNVGNALTTLMGNIIWPCLLGGMLMALITKSKNT